MSPRQCLTLWLSSRMVDLGLRPEALLTSLIASWKLLAVTILHCETIRIQKKKKLEKIWEYNEAP